MKQFVFTCGDINGIGPEIVIKVINRVIDQGNKIIFLCPKNVFENTAKDIIPLFKFTVQKKAMLNQDPEIVEIIDIGKIRQQPGVPTRVSGLTSFKAIKKSFELAMVKSADAIITAPISKHALELAGITYPGHTEMYAEWSGEKNFVMMFISNKMNCALLTIHEPIKNVPNLLSKKLVSAKLKVIIDSLAKDFGKYEPEIALLGLNPHAGENGRIGKEEIDTFTPLIKNSLFSNHVSGPFVPDAFFANKLYKKYDMVVGAYHDQVLIPFKLLNFSSGVNYTAGLPIVRTSPDHGTAFDIAGKNLADESSTLEAFNLAGRIIKNRIMWNRKR